MKIVVPLKKIENNLPLSSMMFINRFEGVVASLEKGKKT